MRVVLFNAGRGTGADHVVELRRQLKLRDGDDLVWISHYLPAEPLPVARHLVLGPSLTRLAVAREVPTAPRERRHRKDHRHTGPEPDRRHSPDESSSPASRRSWSRRTRDGGVYLVKGTRNVIRRNWRPLKTKLYASDNAAVNAVVDTVQLVVPRRAQRFGLAAYRSQSVVDEVNLADVVVASDSPSIPAVWLVGRKCPGPQLVVGPEAARRVIKRRRSDAAAKAAASGG